MFKVTLDRRHQLTFRRERDFTHSLKSALASLCHRTAAELALSHQKRSFCGVAVDFPFAALCLAQVGVTGQATATEYHPCFIVQWPFGQRSPLVLHFSFGHVSHPTDVRVARRRHHALDSHLRARQGAGLVRADYRGGT